METSNALSFWGAERSVAKNLLLVAAAGRAVALVRNFFVLCEEFLRSSLGPGWRELVIGDWRLPITSE
jgi:hypothetical protein